MSTFPEYLRQLDSDELRALVGARPDAFFPTPPSAGSLATRLALPGSASRALRQLTAADLAVLERLADAGAELEPVDATGMGDTSHLRELALVYGPDAQLRVSPGTLSALPPTWRVTDTLPPGAADALQCLPARERKVLQTLAASGGVGTLDHLVDGIRAGGASAVLAASIFHFGTFTVRQAKEHLKEAGLPVRLDV